MATPKLFSLSLLAASALAISTPAMAEVTTKIVQYGDLDLSTADGQDSLKTRVKQAARQVCTLPKTVTAAALMDQNRCLQIALKQAMPKAEQKIAADIARRSFASAAPEAIVGN